MQTKRNPCKNQAGVAMIVVLCAGALLLALAAAVAYSASMASASADNQLLNEQTYQLAKSFSEVLEENLCAPSREDKIRDTEETEQDTLKNTSFYACAAKFMEDTEDKTVPQEVVISNDSYDRDSYFGALSLTLTRSQTESDVLEVRVKCLTARDEYQYAVSYRYTVEVPTPGDPSEDENDGLYHAKFTRRWLEDEKASS